MTSTETDFEEEKRKAEYELIPKVTKEDIDFMFKTMIKEAEHDSISIKQLVYGMFSAFSKVPIPHNVNSKDSGAGKSYLLNKTASYFPQEHVWIFTGMTSKAILHKAGKMVVKNLDTGNLEEADFLLGLLEEQKENIEDKKNNSDKIKLIDKEIAEIKKTQCKLIDLENKIIIIQDTPQDAIFDAIMSLLSQDSPNNQEYLFADKTASGSIGDSKRNIINGMPVLFTTRVIDDTKAVRFEEKNRRSINVTPNVSTQKIKAAMKVIATRYGSLPEEYEELVLSERDRNRCKLIVKVIVEKLKQHSSYFEPKQAGVKIPFEKAIYSSIPDDNVWSMTVIDRTMRYLSVITKVNMDSRPRIVDTQTDAFYPISTFEDLKETLLLMERGGSNIRPYHADFYRNVFKPKFDEVSKELNGNPRTMTINEKVIMSDGVLGLSTDEIAEAFKITGKQKPGGHELRDKYLYPLVNQGIINYSKSGITGRGNIWFPVDEEANIFSMFENSEDLRLNVSDKTIYPSNNILEQEYRIIVREEEKGRYKILDIDGTSLSVQQLNDRYFANPDICFKKGWKEI